MESINKKITDFIRKYYIDVISYLVASIVYFIFFLINNIALNQWSAFFAMTHFAIHCVLMWYEIDKFTKSLFLHHVVSLGMIIWSLITQVGLRYFGIYFLVEINTAFLHLRRRVQRGTVLYSIIDKMNTYTWIFFRLIMYPLLTIALIYRKEEVSIYSFIFLFVNHLLLLSIYAYWTFMLFVRKKPV
jgi:hypothetical protein